MAFGSLMTPRPNIFVDGGPDYLAVDEVLVGPDAAMLVVEKSPAEDRRDV